MTAVPTRLSSSVIGFAVFVTSIEDGVPVIVTSASSESDGRPPSSSVPVTVTTSWITVPGIPEAARTNVQVIGSLPTPSVVGRPLPADPPLQSMSEIVAGSAAPILSTKSGTSSVTGSAGDVFCTVTV